MTGLYLDITSITGFVYSWMPGEQHKNTGSKGQIACVVFPTDQDHLDLETGEIFENPRYAKLRGHQDKAISGRLDVYERGMGEGTVNQMAYLGDTDSDALIHFQYTMPADSYTVLRDHILKGHPPKRVWIECEDEAIGFGWDGSGLNWNNVANRRVVISEIRFDFSYSKNGKDEFYSEPVDRDDFSDAARVARANTSWLMAVERTPKTGGSGSRWSLCCVRSEIGNSIVRSPKRRAPHDTPWGRQRDGVVSGAEKVLL